MGALVVRSEFAEKLCARAKSGALSEAAKIYAYLEYLQFRIGNHSSEFWNVGLSASGITSSQSGVRLRNGSLIWRLCPEHNALHRAPGGGRWKYLCARCL